jgi:very-short-patch-repair endonuclease
MSDVGPILQQARRELLDLSGRNRLLNLPRHRSRANLLEIRGERSEAVLRMLVDDGRGLGFRPRPAPAPEDAGAELFEDLAPPAEPLPAAAPLARRQEPWLATELGAERLQGRLLRLYYDARTHYEERGVNVLYLALGFLEWYEPAAQQPRHAPLILVPVRLERGSAAERFRLWFAEEDIATNLSLAEKLRHDFGLTLPEIDPAERLDAGAYCCRVAAALRTEARFRVHADDIVLGLFSFAKLLMYRDLDPASWPAEMALDQRPLLHALLADGFSTLPDAVPGEPPLDEALPPPDTLHVLDADASQARAILTARAGHNLLIQGPPGTGKSQTIANLIAAAVHDGKTVLFVAEKMAALEVVKRRLDQIGLGELCQELHSRHSNKRALLEELERTLRLGAPRQPAPGDRFEELAATRARLNRHAADLHQPLGNAGVTPFEAIGRLAELHGRGDLPPPLKLPGATHWQRAELRERRDQVAALARRVAELGLPAEHPWRGVGLGALLPSDHQTLRQAIEALREPAAMLCKAATKLQEWLGLAAGAPTFERLERINAACASLAQLPDDVDAAALADPAWQQGALAELVAAGAAFAASRDALRPLLTEAAWSQDLAATRHDLAAHGASWLRWLKPSYRRARAAWCGIATAQAPADLKAQLAVLDQLSAAQAERAQIAAADALGQAAFGHLWAGERSDWRKLGRVLAWRREPRDPLLLLQLVRLLAEVGDRTPPIMLAEQAGHLLQAVGADWARLVERLQLDLGEAFGEPSSAGLTLDQIARRVAHWAERPDALRQWLAYAAQRRQTVALGLSRFAQQLHQGSLPAERAVDAFDQAYYEAQLRQAFEALPALAAFAGPEQDGLIERFQELDRERIQIARREVAGAHHRRLPQRGGEIGQLGLLEREFAKKRRHLPIRQLLARAGQPIQAIKPVLMMSPLSVAEFLAPGAVRFDLVVIDEASQVEPVDAFGALARGTQLVVVGDQRQLPPSPFFKAGPGSDDEQPQNDEDAPPTADLESILGACAAAGMPERMLRWHYRSRHPSLIAVSNREFYDDRLHVVPSPFASHERLGLRFRHVADGRFERGGSAINRQEAEAVARAVIAHARATPELSLGVGCFSLRQRDAILHRLEHLWRAEPPAVRAFFASDKAEPFFVKNLETIQGDERDVMLISVGYGRDPDGHLAMSFGPLNHDGGERRLNVLITRARARLEVFASITDADIDLERAPGRGVAVLKTFLAYAATGVLGLARATERGFGSPFEAAVAHALSGLGHQVDSQIGVAGFFIDLAIRDPARPGRYLLGIECDGAAYHSGLWARDRDRLRQQVLEDQGWILRRVWSADWLRDPAGELARIEAALEDARARWAARDESLDLEVAFAEADDAGDEATVREATLVPVPASARAAPAYVEAAFELATDGEPHRLPPAAMADAVVRIVALEGPVHGAEVARRITRLAGLERTGRRIAEAVGRGLGRAVREQRLVRDGGFYALPETAPQVRDRSSVRSASLRRPDMLPPAEIQAAILQVTSSHYGATSGEIALEVGRLLGFQAAGARLRSLIEAEALQLLASGRLDRQGASLVPAGQREPLPAA